MTKNLRQPIQHELERGFLTIQLQTIRKSFEIKDFATIGRQPANTDGFHIELQDPCVSNRHCRIEKKEKQFWIRDLRSKNGTFLNGTRVQEAALQNGDRLRIGETDFYFSSESATWTSNFHLLSKNPTWQNELNRLPLYAKSNLPVLVQGASGSGKEIIARSIHQLSDRTHSPFISVNCSALTESLIESELFGHMKGSFTGAADDRKGAFLSAKGGTLFLDEIGDLPISLQPKLLRALENQEIKPVGSDRPLAIDVRIVAATHKDLALLVRRGTFREDLFYRLNVLQLKVPTLRERMEDFSDLLTFFARQYRVNFTHEAAESLRGYAWPGQIRELKNFVARAGALYSGQFIEPQKLISLFPGGDRSSKGSLASNHAVAARNIEIQIIVDKLIETSGNIRRSARELGIPKSTLYDRMKNYAIDPKEILLRQASPTPSLTISD